jgi:uncharacterized protein (DUF58 family)
LSGLDWWPTEKAGGYLALVAVGVVAALVSGRPEAAVLACPFAFALAAGLTKTKALGLEARAAAAATAATEGDEVPVRATFSSKGDVAGLEALVSPATGFVPVGPGSSDPEDTGPKLDEGAGVLRDARFLGARAERSRLVPPLAGQVTGGVPLELSFSVRAEHWGRQRVGTVAFRARSFLGFFEASGWARVEGTVLVYPRREPLARLIGSRRASLPAGSHLSRTKGGGLDLAGVRPYAAGDRAKDVNWRASARHGVLSPAGARPAGIGLYTNERHPERGADVVLVVDTFDKAVLHRAVTAACNLAEAYLSQRDRLALLELGGGLRWLRPGMGPRQRQVVVEALLATTDLASAVYRGVTLLPPKLLPTAALVVGISSLEQAEAREAFSDMRARGLDVVVVEVPQQVAPLEEMGRLGRLAVRLWQLERAARREELRAAGVPTVAWEAGEPLAQVVGELDAWARRQARSGF